MSRLARWGQRFVIFAIATATIWFVVTQLFDRLDRRLPMFLAFLATYIIAAYLILPLVIRMSLTLLRRNHIPRVTRAGDGLPADPVNVLLVGPRADLEAAFAAAGWSLADPLTLRTGWRMVTSFVLNRPYPRAPFSPLYLFGRRQDVGFQEPVGNSPRRRHHVRFWAADIDPETEIGNLAYWTGKRKIDANTSHLWVGAATTDTGFGFQSLTYQISHAVDRHADTERDNVVAALDAAGAIVEKRYIDAGTPVGSRFISDGRIFRACLRGQPGKSSPISR